MWLLALRHHALHAGHRHAPADDAVRESAAAQRRTVGDSAGSGCVWCDRTERLPERLAYARYLERQNTEAIQPAPRRPEEAPARGADLGWAKLGEAARSETETERRVRIAYQVRLITPAGRFIDALI